MNNIIRLNNKDYKEILDYYDINYSSMTDKDIKNKAENLISTKLCQCIKKVTKSMNLKDEQPAIGICTNSILKKHNLKYYGFSCDKKPMLLDYYSKNTNKPTLKNVKLTKQNKKKLAYPKKTIKKSKRNNNKKRNIENTKTRRHKLKI